MNEKIGLALAGGGLQGFAHIGAIKALEELGVKPEFVSGTSTGSVIASLYAMGYSTDEMKEICENVYKEILNINKISLAKIAKNYLVYKETRTEGLIDGTKIEDFINKYAKEKDIDKITDIKNRKLAIATVETLTMKQCIFCSEENGFENIDFTNQYKKIEDDIYYINDINIGKAVRASMAFPAIFTTTNYNGFNFIDGGTSNNLPTKILRQMGANKIIAVGLDTSNYTPSKNLEGVLIRALDIFSNPNVEESKKYADIVVNIKNDNTSLISMTSLEETIQNGYNAVKMSFRGRFFQ